MDQKEGGCCAPFVGGAGFPSNTMWPGPTFTSVPSGILIHPAVWPQQTSAENWGLCFLFREGVGSPYSTMWPGPRPTPMPSAILIHPAVLPQQTWAENWGLHPLFGDGKLGPHLTQSRLAEAYLHTKWHLNPSSHLATTDMGRKLEPVPLWGRGSWVPI